MNKEYALDLLNDIECGTLEGDCSLAKEAYRYLINLKKLDNNIYTKICHQRDKWLNKRIIK